MPKQLTKQNSTKAQRRNQQAQLAKRKPQPRPREGNNTMSIYQRMVSDPSRSVRLVGFPDGNPVPSIVYHHKQLISLGPSSTGNVSFIILPGATGGIAVGDDTAFTYYGPNITSPTNSVVDTAATVHHTAGTTVTNYGILPFTERTNASIGKNWNAKTAYQFGASSFRYLAQSAKVRFTGATLNDQGVSVCARSALSPEFSGQTVTLFGSVCNVLAMQEMPKSAQSLASAPGMHLSSAREGLHINNVSVKPEFVDIEQYTCMQAPNGFIGAWGGSPSLNLPGGNLDKGITPTFFSISGLSTVTPVGNITVEVDSIIEYTIPATSQVSGFAVPNPPAVPGLSTWLERAWANAPTASTVLRGLYAAAPYAANVIRATNGRRAIRDEL